MVESSSLGRFLAGKNHKDGIWCRTDLGSRAQRRHAEQAHRRALKRAMKKK
tara:strand:- start:185 stop:337 length:153 start_codon:yes stop_codon:yes gene_type:complete